MCIYKTKIKNIYIYIYIVHIIIPYTLYEVHFYSYTVLFAFLSTTCVMVHIIACIPWFIISLVTGENIYEINELMIKASYDNIWR